MSKTYELSYTAERIDEMLKEVDENTIYSDATTEEHGLMSATDKAKLDALQTGQQIEVSLSEKVDKEAGKGLSTNDYTDEDKAKVASALQTETDPTVPSWAKQSTKPSYDYSEIGNTPDLSGFITKSVNDLTNYYLKSETYTKAEVAALIGAIRQFHYEIYASLPQSGESNVLYLIGPTGSGSDRYEEYVYANNAFTKIGDTSIDLSGYVTTSALNTALADYTTTSQLTALLSNKADKVNNATNGNFAGLDANGNVTDSGKKASDFASPVNVEMQMPATGFLPNTMYELGTLQGDTTFLMAAATDDTILNEWHWSFATPATAPTITWPAAITAWDGGDAPEIVGNHRYEVSVIGGTAAWIDAI